MKSLVALLTLIGMLYVLNASWESLSGQHDYDLTEMYDTNVVGIYHDISNY